MKPFLIFLTIMMSCLPGFSQFHYFFSDSSTNPRDIIAAQHIKRDSIFSCTLRGKKIIDSIFIAAEAYNPDGTIATQTQLLGKKELATLVDSFFYNAAGLLVKQTMGYKGKPVFVINTIDYDSKGLEIGGYSYSRDVKGADTNTSKKEYNSVGQLSKNYLQREGKEMYLAEQRAYDNEGRLSEVNNYKEDGALFYSTLYEYKDDGRRKVVYRKTPNGAKKMMIFYYNQQGRCTGIDWFLSKETWKYRFYYNPDGTLAEYKTVKGKKEETHRHHYSKD